MLVFPILLLLDVGKLGLWFSQYYSRWMFWKIQEKYAN